jgi:fructose-bisphosphate aldolase class 1
MENKDILTSVKVDKDLFDTFKIECVKRKFSLNKLVNRAIDLYINDEDFRKKLTNHNNPKIKD